MHYGIKDPGATNSEGPRYTCTNGTVLWIIFRKSGLPATIKHVANREIAEGHRRGELHPGLIADPLLSRRGNIARSVKPRNGVATLMDHRPRASVNRPVDDPPAG